ncbi:MAG: peptidylprolyl isomerase [Planctomycetota bacterium]|nr:peptidylprolyl isomerase [Planctomycetota bacterium]
MSTILLSTSKGDITIQLDAQKAPVSSKNFVEYVNAGHYDGTIFHRVINGFMIQGGGYTPDMKQKKTNAAIANEWRNGLKNKRGTIAMARLGGNPDSATCQFFINVVDNDFLDRPQPDGAAYAVFGAVTQGMEVVDAIKAVKTGVKSGMGDVPVEAVVITSAKVVG